jgi:hypothetical protein
MNAGSRRGISPDFRQWVAAEQHRIAAERARETAKQAASVGDRAFWLALAANWEKLAKAAEAPKNQALVNITIKADRPSCLSALICRGAYNSVKTIGGIQ